MSIHRLSNKTEESQCLGKILTLILTQITTDMDHYGLIFFDSKREYISQKICIPILVPGIFLLMNKFHIHFIFIQNGSTGKT